MTWPTTRPLALIEPDAQLLARIPIGEAEEMTGDDARLVWVFWCLRNERGDLADVVSLHLAPPTASAGAHCAAGAVHAARPADVVGVRAYRRAA